MEHIKKTLFLLSLLLKQQQWQLYLFSNHISSSYKYRICVFVIVLHTETYCTYLIWHAVISNFLGPQLHHACLVHKTPLRPVPPHYSICKYNPQQLNSKLLPNPATQQSPSQFNYACWSTVRRVYRRTTARGPSCNGLELWEIWCGLVKRIITSCGFSGGLQIRGSGIFWNWMNGKSNEEMRFR